MVSSSLLSWDFGYWWLYNLEPVQSLHVTTLDPWSFTTDVSPSPTIATSTDWGVVGETGEWSHVEMPPSRQGEAPLKLNSYEIEIFK